MINTILYLATLSPRTYAIFAILWAAVVLGIAWLIAGASKRHKIRQAEREHRERLRAASFFGVAPNEVDRDENGIWFAHTFAPPEPPAPRTETLPDGRPCPRCSGEGTEYAGGEVDVACHVCGGLGMVYDYSNTDCKGQGLVIVTPPAPRTEAPPVLRPCDGLRILTEHCAGNRGQK